MRKINKELENDYYMKFEVLKGTKDSLPNEQAQINEVLRVIQNNFEKYGLKPFDTPLIEYFDTLANKYDKDAEIVQEIFRVKDRGKRDLGLRYDLTVPLCRFVASQKQLKLPFKRYQIGKVFRDGPIKTGRLREFMQCDGDVVGVSGVEIEAELLTLFFNTYRELGINAIIEINNNKILKGVLLDVGFKEKDLESLILSIDKLKKIGKKGVLEEIEKKKFSREKMKTALGLLEKEIPELDRLAKKESILKEGTEELCNLCFFLKTLNVKFRVNLSMARGLAIYTGNIWEAFDLDKRVTSSIGSGGRYDKAIGNYIGDGREFPACGISFGLVPIIECIKKNDIKSKTNVLIVPLDKTLTPIAMKLAEKLRKKENVEVCFDYKLKKAFSYAESNEILKLAILGEKDFEKKEYTLKDLKSGKEKKMKL